MNALGSLVVAVLLSAVVLSAGRCEDAIKIGSRLEPFLDDYLIEKMDGVELQLQHPILRETVITFDAPWEGDTSAYVTVFKDGDKYRMYYRGSAGDSGHEEVTCTAESADGIHWTKPNLGLFEVAGTKENNVVWVVKGGHAFAPFKDPNPSAKPEELYKAVAPSKGDANAAVLDAYVSADGYRWKQVGTAPIITDGRFDSQNLAFWDAERKEYVCYYRDYRNSTREIKRSTSRDFVHWTPGEWVTYNLAPEQYYTNAIIPYFRAPHIYVGFPKRFVLDRKAVESHPYPGVSDGVFISSRDGLVFHKWLEGFHRPGLDQGNWTDRNNMAAWGILELKPGEVSIYYSQHYRHPTNGIVRTTIRTDGFVSVHAGSKAGEMVTKPLVFDGKELVINYSTSAVGGVQVEIQDAEGKPVSGFALDDCPVIYGDEIERVVKWKSGSDLSSLAGKPIRLRFRMTDGDLYSMRFRDE
jgi:hypothetical protein